MEHINTTNADVKEKYHCMSWLPRLWNGLLPLLFQRRVRDTDVSGSSPLHDEQCMLNNSTFGNYPLIHGSALSDDNTNTRVAHNDPLLYCSPLNRPFHVDAESLNDSVLLGNSDIDPQKTLLALPDDIIIDILSRLTFECALLCRRVGRPLCELMSGPPYNHKLLTRTAPIVVIQCKSLWCKTYDEENMLRDYHAVFHFVYENGSKIVPATTKFKLSYAPKYYYKPSLIGSYNGLLMFTQAIGDACIIFNPVTQEKVFVLSEKYTSSKVCGLYFHKETSEYRLLYMQRTSERFCRFFVLSLPSQLLREISSCTVAPCTCRSPVILNGALHWMATVSQYACLSYESPSCSNSILVFNMDKETFMTLPHPGSQCCSTDKHSTMQLLEMDGRLCLFDISLSTSQVYIWVLQNYTENVWAKEHIIYIKPRDFVYIPNTHSHYYPYLRVVMFQNGELLFQKRYSDLFYYHLKRKTFREVKKTGFENEVLDSVVAHTHTLASLQCDNVISFSF